MVEIPIIAVPNQTFSVELENSIYQLTIRFAINFMIVDMVRDSEVVMSGIRIMPNFRMIPYRFLEQGNFFLLTANGLYPDYTQFGITQFLVYATQAELEEARNARA